MRAGATGSDNQPTQEGRDTRTSSESAPAAHQRLGRVCYRPWRMDAASLRACPLFQTLSSEQVGRIAAITTRREVPGGTAIFVEGSSGGEMYVLLSGKVRISKRLPGVGEEALAILEPGAYFGEMAMVDDSPRSADALAHTGCAVAVIKREELEQLMFIDKDMAYVLLWTFVRTLSVRLREMNEKIQGFFAMTGPFR